jgi:succinate dehydrogenase / fumarate reductase, cytochrome b subunit
MATHKNPALGCSVLKARLFSLFGIVPLGTYLIVHLANNTKAVYGAAAYNQYLTDSKSSPIYFALMLIGFYFPLAWHTVVGLKKASEARPNLLQYSHFRNLKFVLQRLSALGLLAFIPAHIFKTRIEPWLHGINIDFNHMVEGFHESLPVPGIGPVPYVTVVVYLLGTLGACFHFANGLWGASISLGLITNAQSQKRFEIFTIGLFLALYAMAVTSIYGIYFGA